MLKWAAAEALGDHLWPTFNGRQAPVYQVPVHQAPVTSTSVPSTSVPSASAPSTSTKHQCTKYQAPAPVHQEITSGSGMLVHHTSNSVGH